jgi:hypothetical protein
MNSISYLMVRKVDSDKGWAKQLKDGLLLQLVSELSSEAMRHRFVHLTLSITYQERYIGRGWASKTSFNAVCTPIVYSYLSTYFLVLLLGEMEW